MKIIIQTKEHVTIRFTWREIGFLDVVLASWRWAVGEQKVGAHRMEWRFVTAFRGVIHKSVDKREVDAHKSH